MMAELQPRIVLLLDLDCFYAQCESVRLGLDPSIPLALLQWDSALAVNYPARAFGIKRGDSFADISTKSGGRCSCIHLPILPVGVENGTSRAATTALSEEEAYQKEFCLPPNVQNEAFLREKNVLRKQSEGKASLDRYRLASSRIFATILKVSCRHLTSSSVAVFFFSSTGYFKMHNDYDFL
jgi:nucleotidyltransferase/DNA polymerase involved in DNA repair